jgi:hypothetical protein
MAHQKWFWTETMDHLLRTMYDPTVRGRPKEITDRLRVPRWAVNRRAAALGLSRPKDRPWSEREEALRGGQLPPGFGEGDGPQAEPLTHGSAAEGEAAEDTEVRGGLHCLLSGPGPWRGPPLGPRPQKSGKLRASHRHTDRTSQQGGDSWLITEAALIDFLTQHSYEIDLRKVDSLWFMDLIVPYLQGRQLAGREAA